MWRWSIIALILISIVAISNVETISIKKLAGEEPKYIIDALGRMITLYKTPEKVVSLAPSITEFLAYLDVLDKIIAADNYSINDPYFNISVKMQRIGAVNIGGYWWSGVDVETILRLGPDIVLADKGAHQPLLNVFEENNITVVYLNAGSSRSINDIIYDLDLLATIFDKKDVVPIFIEKVEDSFNQYRSMLTSYSGLRVLVVIDISNGIWVAGKATYIDDILNRLGLVNAVSKTGWVNIGLEEIREYPPEIILLASLNIDQDKLVESGLYDLNITIAFLKPEYVDALSRPGPLVMNLPRYIYKVITNTTHVRNTSTISESRETSGLEQILYITIPLSFLAGIGVGYVLGARRKQSS